MWQDLLAAIALVLVIEGILPFLNPPGYRRTLLLASQMNDKTMRTIGFSSMAAGLVLLYLLVDNVVQHSNFTSRLHLTDHIGGSRALC